MGLDFGHTCPDIDKEKDYIKECFFSAIKGLLEQYNGQELTAKDTKDIANDYKDQLYADVEQCFEGVRKTNTDMRSVADYQIDEIDRELEDFKAEVEELSNEVSTKQDQIDDLESQIFDLNKELDRDLLVTA